MVLDSSDCGPRIPRMTVSYLVVYPEISSVRPKVEALINQDLNVTLI